MIEKLFFAALVLIPFTSIEGLPALGEIRHEVSAYLFLLMMALSGFVVMSRFRVRQAPCAEDTFYLLPRLMLIILGVIAISFAANFLTIKDSYFLGRSGLEKFFSSVIVVLYGFGIASMTYYISAKRPWDSLLLKPMTLSVVICAVFSVFEIAGRMSGSMFGLFKALSAPIYGTFDILEWDTLLRSVAFEPQDFANTAGYLWPWLLAATLYSQGTRRFVMGSVFAILNIMILLSEARTSFVVIGGMLLVFFALLFIFSNKDDGKDPEKMLMPMTLIFAIVVPSCLVLFWYFYDYFVYQVVAGDNISNLSRLASITAALRMFEANPIFGLGFGQFGFHATAFMPSWGFYSPEIKAWLFGSGTFWPSVYSVYARFAADMGVMGLLMWVSVWLWIARTLIVETLRYRKETGDLPFAAFPLIMSCFCVLLAGVPCDSIRSPMIWINMGLACRYLWTIKQRPQQQVTEQESSR